MVPKLTLQHIYIYICAVKLKSGPRFGGFKVKKWSKLKVKKWSKFFFHCFSPHFYSVLGAFLEAQIVQQCVKIVFLQNLGDVKNEVFEKKIAFFVFFLFYVGKIETEKRKKIKWKRAKNPIKIGLFLRWSSKNVKNQKKWIFSKYWLTLCVSVREKKRAFSCTLSVLAKNFFWPKTVQTRKNYKNSGFSRNCPKPKMTPFFWKRVFFDMGEKVGFTNCVFQKLCFPENIIFIVFSAKHSFSKTKTGMLKKTENIMKNSGLFLNMAKWCFLGWCFFEVLVLLWFVFGVFGIVPGV